MSGRRRFRPGTFSLLGMILVNAVVAAFVLKITFAIFGVHQIIPTRLSAYAITQSAAKWEVLWPMVPGAAIAFACLWFILILVGRSRGINWTAAAFYGIGIAYADVLVGGFLIGLMHGNPLLGLLIGFAMLLIMPQIWLSMGTFGIIMGLFNANAASRWIEKHRPRD